MLRAAVSAGQPLTSGSPGRCSPGRHLGFIDPVAAGVYSSDFTDIRFRGIPGVQEPTGAFRAGWVKEPQTQGEGSKSTSKSKNIGKGSDSASVDAQADAFENLRHKRTSEHNYSVKKDFCLFFFRQELLI
ncbi:hypothetical protein NDU88_008595 [Pleurodeles waltl]|uniref:Uncharacterized protein n=1 Tax=Pleurodeles waltl TaxID=8319 RepID=A0AAV7PTD0_PLEWA|nr:hypothetical protein NDU88_008595 [Pleurodeles waltl]